MATFKVKSKKGKYHDENTYRNLVEYVSSSAKVRDGGVIGRSVVPACAVDAMKTVAHAYHKDNGLKMRHCILSYGTEENVSFQDAKDMACQIMDCGHAFSIHGQDLFLNVLADSGLVFL